MGKCAFPNGVTIKPDGVHPLDPCVYEEIERYENVTVSVLRCQNCGHIEIEWVRQANTRKIEIEKE